MNKLHKKRSDADFSEHELIINRSDEFTSFRLKHKEYNYMLSVEFINIRGVLLVVGDYGSWVFTRGFEPSKDGYVSDNYWMEKLGYNSEQDGFNFDPHETEKQIHEDLKQLEEDLKYDDITTSKYEIYKEYYENIDEYVYDELEYTYHAYRTMPSDMDYESVPFIKCIKIQLLIIFDAFEEMCRRMEE